MKYVALVLITCFLGTAALSMGVNNAGSVTRKRSPSNKSAVDAIALKIGLKVVVSNKLEAGPEEQDNKKKKGRNNTDITIKRRKKKRRKQIVPRPPTIIWGKNARRFFWGEDVDDSFQDQHKQYLSYDGGRHLKVERICNENGFPLYQIHNVLQRQSLDHTLSVLMDDENISSAEELEQHELVAGKPETLRRSLVSQLTYSSDDNRSREIMDLVLAGLPSSLVEGISATINDHPHPYEDGSIVYYRANDFYHTHHDSYDPENPRQVREKQRAYTILIYLKTPHGSERVGGTEFPRLRTLDSKHGKETIDDVLVVKPKAGDCLVWPNFDLSGRPYLDSTHGALPIPKTAGRDDGFSNNEDEARKIVLNLWFEGRMK